MWKVQLFKLNFDEKEAQAVQDVINSGWITMGEKTREFESRFAELIGSEVETIAVSNGTAALHLALLALGIESGDEVIIPSLTFVADINVVRMVGASPVLADCTSYEDWNISPIDMERKITPRTKAIMIMHYGGYPCEMDSILKLCKKHKLYLIEDAAHAPYSKYKGISCGAMGDIGCFSFFTNKNLSVGEGGMVVTCSSEIADKLKYLRSHGMTTLSFDRHKGRAISYDVIQPGLNYRIDEMRSALGIVQLDKLPEAQYQRKVLVEDYIDKLGNIDGFTIPFLHQLNNIDYRPSYHIFPILLDEGIERLKLIESLKKDGIQSSIHYPVLQEFAAYKNKGLTETPIASAISVRELTLPLYPTMTKVEVDLVIEALKKGIS